MISSGIPHVNPEKTIPPKLAAAGTRDLFLGVMLLFEVTEDILWRIETFSGFSLFFSTCNHLFLNAAHNSIWLQYSIYMYLGQRRVGDYNLIFEILYGIHNRKMKNEIIVKRDLYVAGDIT